MIHVVETQLRNEFQGLTAGNKVRSLVWQVAGRFARDPWDESGIVYLLQGCRFGPKSKPNRGKQYLDP